MQQIEAKIRKLDILDTQNPFGGLRQQSSRCVIHIKKDGMECPPFWIPFSSITKATLHQPEEILFFRRWVQVLRLETINAIYDISASRDYLESLDVPFHIERKITKVNPRKINILLLILFFIIAFFLSTIFR